MVDSDANVSDSRWMHIRYQLLTAITGTILQAQIEGSALAVLVVHEFKTDATNKDKHKHNHLELEKLLSILSGGTINDVEPGILYDGFCVDSMDLMLGKIVTEL